MGPFDYILTGGGMAGLSLAYHMHQSPLHDKEILIVDREPKFENDRTWCFWTREKTAFEPILYRNWNRLQFHHHNFSKTYSLAPYRYQMLRGIDFYQHTQAELKKAKNIHFLYGDVQEITSETQGASVLVDGRRYQAKWVFDSLFLPGEFKPEPDRYHNLWQHFKGWVINTQRDVFDPESPTLFDFRTPQAGAMRFIYILPFSKREALVEYTLFSPKLLTEEAYNAGIEGYIRDVLGLSSYDILEEEQGRIPMTDQPFPRFSGPFHMPIGTKGGRVKPSTGYTFLRTQQDSQAIVRSLLQLDDPTHIPPDRRQFRLFDSIMLEVMEKNGGRMSEIFTAMFKHNPIQRIFRFLDEDSQMLDHLALFSSVPPGPFLKALMKTGLSPGR